MSLFGGDENDDIPIVRELVANAEGATVTGDSLTDSNLNENVLKHIDEKEHPHHILKTKHKTLQINNRGVQQSHPSSNGNATVTVLTDRRILFLVGEKSRDKRLPVEYSTAHEFTIDTGFFANKLSIATRDKRYTTYFSSTVDTEAVSEFLDRKIQGSSEHPTETSREPSLSERISTLSPREVKQALRTIDEYEFEEVIAEVWEAMGWEATVTKASADRGVDVVATRDEPFQQKQVIQVKRYAEGNTVGSPEIQQYASLSRQEAGVDSVVVVTTSSFTRQAKQTAEDLNVKLIDGDDLYEFIDENGLYRLLTEYSVYLPSHRIAEKFESRRPVEEPQRADREAEEPDTEEPDTEEPDTEEPDTEEPDSVHQSAEAVEPEQPSTKETADAVDDSRQVVKSESPSTEIEFRTIVAEKTGRFSDEIETWLEVPHDIRERYRGATTKYGSLLVHVLIFLLTGWWTFGLGNLVYSSWKYHHYEYPDAEHDPEKFETTTSQNWYYGVLGSLAILVLSFTFGSVGVSWAPGAGLLAAWILLPASLYHDVQYVRATTKWNPLTVWWVLGVLLPVVNFFVVLGYVVKRYFVTGTFGSDVPPIREVNSE